MKIGIDFGTTYTKIAYLDPIGLLSEFAYPPGPSGRPYVPTAVAYRAPPKGSDLAMAGIGQAARNMAVSDSDIIFCENFKMLLPLEAADWAPVGWPTTRRSPIEVTADFLGGLIKRDTKSFLREIGKVASVVLSVPEVWHRTLGNAGIERLRQIFVDTLDLPLSHMQSEPVCAAAALAFHLAAAGTPFEGKLLICDVGGGTFDVALCAVSGNKISVLDFDGNGHAGLGTSGVMFDRNAALLAYQARHKADPAPGDPEFTMLLRAFEEAKIQRSDELADMLDLRRAGHFANGSWRFHPGYELTMEQFDTAFEPIRLGIETTLRRLEQRAAGHGNRIDRVMVVGGFGQFRPVREAIFAAIGHDPNGSSQSPLRGTERDSLAIARGAALIANNRIQTEERYPHTIALAASPIRDGLVVQPFGPEPIIVAGQEPVGDQGVTAFARSNGTPRVFEVYGSGMKSLPVLARARGEGEWLSLQVPAQALPPQGAYQIGVEIDRSNRATLLFRPVSGAQDIRYELGAYSFDLFVRD
jgi:molecular chaperone DnaK